MIARWRAEEQQPFQGWDFSYLEGRYHEEQPTWSYDRLVRDLLNGADSVLDMGTGGGEKLLEFQDALPPNTIATEGHAPNVPVARANLEPHGITVVEYDVETDQQMPFTESSFELVINRHEAYDSVEVARILRADGIFLTQQVDGRDLGDLLSIFGTESHYLHVNLEHCRQLLESAGLKIDRAQEWAGKATYKDVGALVYYLHAAPWDAPENFSVDRYANQLLRLHHEHQPLTFTIRRFFIQASKPA